MKKVYDKMAKGYANAGKPAPKPAVDPKAKMTRAEAGNAKLRAAEAAGRARQASARRK